MAPLEMSLCKGGVFVKETLFLLCSLLLVMDVLSSLFNLAESRGLLQDLGEAGIKNRLSLYADDVVLFVRPVEDLNCVEVSLDCLVQLLVSLLTCKKDVLFL
jgi:hypothetical protein